jgi:hypothetical protein
MKISALAAKKCTYYTHVLTKKILGSISTLPSVFAILRVEEYSADKQYEQ